MSPDHSLNLAVLRGRVTSDPGVRELPSGSHVVQFDVSTCDPDDHRVSVPVSWLDPAEARRRDVEADAEIVVVGWVRRRFFRANGTIQSRTEVVAERVVPARRRRAVENLLAGVAAAIGGS